MKDFLFYQNQEAYTKNEKVWSFENFNVPQHKKDDLISRFSVGKDENSFFLSTLYDHTMSQYPPKKRIEKIMEKQNDALDELSHETVFLYFDYMFERFLHQTDDYLSNEFEFENLDDFDINQNLFEIIQEKLIENKNFIMKELKKAFQNGNKNFLPDYEANFRSIEKVLFGIYEEIAKDEIETIMSCDRYPQSTKTKYLENVRLTLKNILILIGNLVMDTFMEETKIDRPEERFMLFKMMFPNKNLLITEIKSTKENKIEYNVLEQIDFEKHINTENDFIVLLYFPETNTYERILYESFHANQHSFQQSKKYPYKNYSFPYDHPLIENLLLSLQ